MVVAAGGGLCLVLGGVIAAGWGRCLVLEEEEEESTRHTSIIMCKA